MQGGVRSLQAQITATELPTEESFGNLCNAKLRKVTVLLLSALQWCSRTTGAVLQTLFDTALLVLVRRLTPLALPPTRCSVGTASSKIRPL